MSTPVFEHKNTKESYLILCSLSVYRKLLDDEVISKLHALLEYISKGKIHPEKAVSLYTNFFFTLADSNPSCSLRDHIIYRILTDENIFSLTAEKLKTGHITSWLKNAVYNDLRCLQLISSLPAASVKEYIIKNSSLSDIEKETIERLPEWNPCITSDTSTLARFNLNPEVKDTFISGSWPENTDALFQYYKSHGCGMFSIYRGFIWEREGSCGLLRGIENPDPVTLSDLIGYEIPRSEVIGNTLQFIKGLPANNVLLYGDRGTGKSSTVKAILNEYHSQGLRVIEVPKNNLIDFPHIIKQLEGRNFRFIIFVDDLAFEDNEENYTALKAALEGGLRSKPENVLIYATSNRRHLIKEKFSDRAGLKSSDHDDEVRAMDSIQEKLSLADRFGMTVVFSSPDKRNYLEIVEGIALKRGLIFDKEQLHREALKWEMWYNGRSPRTARQFIDWFEGQIKKQPGIIK